jgi:hypothetical protein
MAKLKDNGFHVKLDGVELSEASRIRIQNGIQEVLLRELAGYFPNPDDTNSNNKHLGGGIVIVPPRFWWGRILRVLSPGETEGIKGLQHEINSQRYEAGF